MSESRMKRSKKKVFGVIYGRSLMVILLLIVPVSYTHLDVYKRQAPVVYYLVYLFL